MSPPAGDLLNPVNQELLIKLKDSLEMRDPNYSTKKLVEVVEEVVEEKTETATPKAKTKSKKKK